MGSLGSSWDGSSPVSSLLEIVKSSFNGFIRHFDGDEEKTVPVKIKNLLLRGCVIRNTDFIIGMVVYSGNQTKTMLNNGTNKACF